MTDSEIVSRSLDDAAQFATLFDRHAPAIHRFVHRRTNPAVADDVVSETFLVAFERRAGYDTSRTSAAPWLYGIATRLLSRHRRQEVRMLRALSRLPVDRAQDDQEGGVDDQLDAQRAIADIAHVLRSLPAAQRDALLLLAWADLTYDQIAQALDVPVGTIRSRISRARVALKPHVDSRTRPATTAAVHTHGMGKLHG